MKPAGENPDLTKILSARTVVGPFARAQSRRKSFPYGRKVLGAIGVLLRRSVLLSTLVSLAGCAGGLGQTYMVRFMPFSATPDAQGQGTVQSAIAYAKANPLAPVAIDGFHYGQYSNQVDTMAEERVRVVVFLLVQGGVDRAMRLM